MVKEKFKCLRCGSKLAETKKFSVRGYETEQICRCGFKRIVYKGGSPDEVVDYFWSNSIAGCLPDNLICCSGSCL